MYNIFVFDFLGEVTVDLNFQLVIDTVFNNDLLNRSSNKFMAMEENIKMAVREGITFLKGFLCRLLSCHTYKSTKKQGIIKYLISSLTYNCVNFNPACDTSDMGSSGVA